MCCFYVSGAVCVGDASFDSIYDICNALHVARVGLLTASKIKATKA